MTRGLLNSALSFQSLQQTNCN